MIVLVGYLVVFVLTLLYVLGSLRIFMGEMDGAIIAVGVALSLYFPIALLLGTILYVTCFICWAFGYNR